MTAVDTSITNNGVRAWFRKVWSGSEARVLGEYAAAGRLGYFIADVARRGMVMRSTHVPGDAHTSAFNEGRRSLAVEIISLAGGDAGRLIQIVQAEGTGEKK